MKHVTAETEERGRSDHVLAATSHRLRWFHGVRARLSDGRRVSVFDVELLRMFAERHRGATPAMGTLAFVVAGVATIWVPVTDVLIWLSLLCSAMVVLSGWTTTFLFRSDTRVGSRQWTLRFILGEGAQGAAWALIVALLLHVRDPAAQTFVLFVLLLVAATTAMLSATLPAAVYASLAPITIAIVVFTRPVSGYAALPLMTLAGAAVVFFIVLARRLYGTAVETLVAQAEKDALIVELEQSKLNSDEARRRAEEASLAKSRFLATMSHELRTPLNAILGFSEVMKGELFGPHTVSAYREYSDDIHSSGQHLLMLINEILDLSRVEAGRYELKEESVALAHVVDDCQRLLELRAGKRNITLVDLVEGGLPLIWVDERAIRQVILNLLSNAIKFTPHGGTVTIKVGWTVQGGQYVSIRDTGPGIPEAEIPVVMSSFGRGTLAQKNAEEGSGLGLPIVKGLIELHGGTFTLKSKLREGTEVIVILPPERIIDPTPQDNSESVPVRTERRRRTVRSAA
ncbi:sensor histidine kinase [Lichenihabitans psoromatis]|uniref:sensor histidine kinase n=1 Tax=Lichenihabitans psoromatis TaxID=2528642 RepID=UPI001038396F